MLKDIYEICINRGFFIPSFEPYGTVGGFYDYGPLGVLMKRRIINEWRRFFLARDEIFELETSIINIEKMLQASGHVDNFNDPIVRCQKCNNEFRADKLLSEKLCKNFDGVSSEELSALISKHGVTCPSCKGALSEVKKFNMMFELDIGATGKQKGYLRPETAQGLFVAFPRIYKTYGSKLPIGLAQVGKSFRNEISPRKGLTRMREFTQMEIEYFFDPEEKEFDGFKQIKGTVIRMLTAEQQAKSMASPLENTVEYYVSSGVIPNQIMGYFIALEQKFYESMGIPRNMFWFRELGAQERPHYSGGNIDMEVQIGDGVVETIGNAYRTDYDLSRHQQFSGQDMSVQADQKRLIPHVVEPSMGFDRLFYCILSHCFRESSPQKEWSWFQFPFSICPYQVAVFPLMKKDGLAEKAREVYEMLKPWFSCYYSQTGNIGKRYARADEIGTYFAVTIDYETLEDDTVTIRFRDNAEQVRCKISSLKERILELAKEWGKND